MGTYSHSSRRGGSFEDEASGEAGNGISCGRGREVCLLVAGAGGSWGRAFSLPFDLTLAFSLRRDSIVCIVQRRCRKVVYGRERERRGREEVVGF